MPTTTQSHHQVKDKQSELSLNLLAEQEKIQANRVAGVRTALVVLSSVGMIFDTESLRQKIIRAYPDAAVFFRTTAGKPLGAPAPQQVDLLIDFTGPKQRQCLFYARKLRRMARVAVGRNAGLFRRRLYDRVFDESKVVTREILAREHDVQKEVLALAGVALIPTGDLPADRAHTIALELPPLSRV